MLKTVFFKRSALACGLTTMLVLLQCDYSQAGPNNATSLDAGFKHMYNLDFAAAHRTFATWQELHPDDPLGAASNAAAYLFSEFERLHILELDLFADNQRLEKMEKLEPDPKIKSAFEKELSKADKLAEKILDHSSDDSNALLAKVLTDGLRGDYAALVEKRNRAGLNFLKSSRSTAEKLIEVDPNCFDAYLAIGIENYLLGLKSAPMRWMLRLSGAQANKDKGLAKLRMTAENGRFLAPYARLLLAIAALRDQDMTTAKKLLSALADEFPQNRLYRTELARLEAS
jgi:hypothetical protein